MGNREMKKEDIKVLALTLGFNLKPQSDGSMDLNPYVYHFAMALLAAAPTPPAQSRESLVYDLTAPVITPPAPEVEPVADLTVSDINGRKDAHFDYYGTLENGQYLLYTHPANDGLRKAAEDAFEVLDGVRTDYIDVKNNLRAELDKDKSC